MTSSRLGRTDLYETSVYHTLTPDDKYTREYQSSNVMSLYTAPPSRTSGKNCRHFLTGRRRRRPKHRESDMHFMFLPRCTADRTAGGGRSVSDLVSCIQCLLFERIHRAAVTTLITSSPLSIVTSTGLSDRVRL